MNGEHMNEKEVITTERIAQHTPGPWSNERIWDTPASRIHARVDGIPMALAEVFTMRNAGEKEANARLIAAAPDLLAACKAALGAFERADAINWDDLQRAIDKAEGRS